MAKRSNDIPIKLEKIKPKPGQLRRYSTSNSTIQLGEPARNMPMKQDKIKPKPGPVRRYSTGNSMIQISESNIPNYLRSSSISSCHDFCKYGKKHDSKTTSKPPRITTKKDDQNAAKEERLSLSDKNYRRKKFNLASSTEGEKVNSSVSTELKPKRFAANHEFSRQSSAAEKQPKKAFLKSSNNIRANQADARKDRIRGKSSNFLPKSSSSISVKVPTPKSNLKKVSNLEIESCVKKSETDKTSNVKNENVPVEKIIHVIEATQDDENRNGCADAASSPSSNQDQEMVSAAELEENDSSPGSLEFKAEEVIEIEYGDKNGGPMVKELVSDEEITIHNKNDGEEVEIDDGESKVKDLDSDDEIMIHHKNDDLQQQVEETKCENLKIEEAARKLIEIRKNKVMDLVAAFERLINNQDSESPIPTIF